MLLSSAQYLQALRSGQYLVFLDWLRFIAADTGVTDADALVNFLVFEWVNNDYSKEDAQKVALLSAVYDYDPGLLSGNLAYAHAYISVALSQCMVYDSHNVLAHFKRDKKITLKECEQLMESILNLLGKDEFELSMQIQQELFGSWVKSHSIREKQLLCQKLRPMVNKRSSLDQYITALELAQLSTDALKATRLSVLKRLVDYLTDKAELNGVVDAGLKSYIDAVRKMNPAEFELAYLNNLSPPTLIENAVRGLAGHLNELFFSTPQETASDKNMNNAKPYDL